MVVHHVRYPKVLGEEKLAWLYSLCVPCHDEIHRLHSSMTLRKATAHVLGQPPPPADWRAHRRRSKAQKKAKPTAPKPKSTFVETSARQRQLENSAKVKKKRGLKGTLISENERAHEIHVRAREARAARREES